MPWSPAPWSSKFALSTPWLISVTGYKNAIELDDKYVDAYYNLGALYVNESQEIQSIANDFDGEKYEQEMKRGQETMQKGIPYLEKVLTFTPNDVK